MAKDNRFIISHKDTGIIDQVKVFTDTETGVQYLFVQSGYGGGLTVLVDKEGKPLLDERYAK